MSMIDLLSKQGLLGQPLIDFGTGLLSKSGYSATPTTFGEAFSAGMNNMSAAQERRLKNDYVRQGLAARKRKNKASSELRSLLSVPTGTTGVLRPDSTPGTPEYEANMMGLLAQINPEAVASGLLSQSNPRTSTDIATMQALGIPTTAEGFVRYQSMKGQQDPTAQLDMMNLQLQVAQLARELQQDQTETTEQRLVNESTSKSMLADLSSMMGYLDEIRNTALETGIPMPELRSALASGGDAVMKLFGKNPAVGRKLRTSYDLFLKGAQRVSAAEASRISGGNPTDAARTSAASYSPNKAITIDANFNVIATMMKDILNQGAIKGYDLNAEDYELKIQSVLNPQVEMIPGFDGLSPVDQAELMAVWPSLSQGEKSKYIRGSK